MSKFSHAWWVRYLSLWIDLATSIVGILSFGFYYPGWLCAYWTWATRRAYAGCQHYNLESQREPK